MDVDIYAWERKIEMIRLISVILFFSVFFIVTIPVDIVLVIMRKYNRNLSDRISRHFIRWTFRCILAISGTKIEARGMENIPKDQAVLYVGNHNSYYDIISSYTLLPGPTGYVAKKEMIKYPFLSWWMIFIDCIFIDRKNIKEGLKAILAGVDQIKSGVSMFVFPEGTRSKNGEMAPFKEGSMKMATKSDAPNVPVAFTNTRSIWEAQTPKKKSINIIIEFGKPIIISELSKEEQKHLGVYTQNRIKEMLENA